MNNAHKLGPGAKRHRILIVDDHPMTRHGLAQLINHEPDLTVCGEAAAAHPAFAAIPSLKPNLVLADITMPGKSGLEFIKDMKARYPEIPVLVISMHNETLYAERVLRAGGRGYVMKSEGGEKILHAIREVLQGEVFVSRSLAANLLGNWTKRVPAEADRPLRSLTDREFEVLQLIGQGLPTMEIAHRLNVSIKTVGTHRVHIKEKLKLNSAAELVRFAIHWTTIQGVS